MALREKAAIVGAQDMGRGSVFCLVQPTDNDAFGWRCLETLTWAPTPLW